MSTHNHKDYCWSNTTEYIIHIVVSDPYNSKKSINMMGERPKGAKKEVWNRLFEITIVSNSTVR